MKNLLLLVSFSALVSTASSIWCYQCVGSHPGCGLYDFDWRYYWSYSCPDPYDKCVKIIEQKGVDIMVTRDCLSNLEGHRRDIPADRYEGCRPAAKDPLVGQYIFPSVPEIDHKRDHFTSVTFCFCDFDERCNSACSVVISMLLLIVLTFQHIIIWG